MGLRIDQFSEDIRMNLALIDMAIATLKAKIDGRARDAERDVRDHLENIERHIERNRTKVALAIS